MKDIKKIFAAVVVVLGLSSRGVAMPVVERDNMDLNLGGRMQLFGFGQQVHDPYRNDPRVYLFMKQARLQIWGHYEKYKYEVQLGFAGEEEVKAPSPGVSLNLMDYSFDIPLADATFLKVGQYKVPYGRERLEDSGYLQFADRSIQNLALRVGRDVGFAVHSYPGRLAWTAGVFTGGGRDVPERYLPQDLGVPMVVVRAGFNDGVDEDIYHSRQNDLDPQRTKTAFFLNGLYMRDSLVGHSTVLNVKTSEKSLLVNSNWNPFVAQSPFDRGELVQGGGDAAVRTPLGPFALSAEVEGNFGRYTNAYGSLQTTGGRAQLGLYRNPVELSIRYAFVIPDSKFAYYDTATKKSYAITGHRAFQEVTPALTYYLKGRRSKIILDLPILVDVPVLTEKNVGSYVVTEQPDQTSVLKAGSVDRQTVVEGRALFQVSF
ncbi:MAG TPA: porin [Elusimicrobiota bacterium]|nr:porin [Elusimicrobiota bacterium]